MVPVATETLRLRGINRPGPSAPQVPRPCFRSVRQVVTEAMPGASHSDSHSPARSQVRRAGSAAPLGQAQPMNVSVFNAPKIARR